MACLGIEVYLIVFGLVFSSCSSCAAEEMGEGWFPEYEGTELCCLLKCPGLPLITCRRNWCILVCYGHCDHSTTDTVAQRNRNLFSQSWRQEILRQQGQWSSVSSEAPLLGRPTAALLLASSHGRLCTRTPGVSVSVQFPFLIRTPVTLDKGPS